MFTLNMKLAVKAGVALGLACFFTLWFAPWLVPQLAIIFIIGALLYSFYSILMDLSNCLVTSCG